MYLRPGLIQWILLSQTLVLGVGCAPRVTRFFIDDHSGHGPASRYFEQFPECYYASDAGNHIDVVGLRRIDQDDPQAEPVTQAVHIREVWQAIPGQTHTQRSMINATVSYYIVGPDGGASYEGGGFVTYRRRRHRADITGKLESSALAANRSTGQGADIFERIAVTGTFHAQRDKRRVIRILSEMERLLGPLPRYEPSPEDPDLR